jgi:peptidyl-prolyl cis-trans isomerase SurA
MKRLWIVACLILALMPVTLRAQEVTDRVVAVVNNDVITSYELNNLVAAYVDKAANVSKKEERETIIKETRPAMLNRMIEDQLVEQEAKKGGIVVKEEDVMAAISDMLARRNIKLEEFKTNLIKAGSSFDEYKTEVKNHLMKMRVATKEVRAKIAVSDEEIGDYYSKNRTAYEGKESVRLQQIFIALPGDADEGRREQRKGQADAILKRLRGGEPFELLASQFSQESAAQTGGDLGFVERGTLHPRVEEVAFKLQPGEISEVVASPIGFHILRVTDRRGKGTKSLSVIREEIKEEITKEKMDKKVQEWIQELRKKSYVEIRL